MAPRDQHQDFVERRRFGRRRTVWHAWIKVPGREKEPCVVRNFALEGALLTFPGQMPVAQRFRLIIDVVNFEAECFVRHRSGHGVGVYFDEFALSELPPGKPRPAEIVRYLQEEEARRCSSAGDIPR